MKNDDSHFIPEDKLPKSEIPAEVNDPALWGKVPRYQLIYSIIGLLLGFVSIVGGIILLMNGIWGSTNWTTKILGSESVLTDATPGVILFVLGFFIVFATRFNIKVRK